MLESMGEYLCTLFMDIGTHQNYINLCNNINNICTVEDEIDVQQILIFE